MEATPKARWKLDQPSFDTLLRAFHPDRDQAGHHYEALRECLVRFFIWNQVDTPEELADETLDRLARRVSADESEVLDPAKFATGIARMLLKERQRGKERRERSEARAVEFYKNSLHQNHESAECEERLAMLEKCLDSIPSERRELMERYFSSEGRDQALARQQLAQEQGISMNALRNRVLRARAELEKCYAQMVPEKIYAVRVMFQREKSQYSGR